MKTIIAILFLAFTIQAQTANTKLGKVLLSIENKKVSKFINKIYKHAVMVRDSYNVPICITIGISCYETGYGTSKACKELKNWFGLRQHHKICIYEARIESFHHFGRTLNQSCYRSLKPKTMLDWFYAILLCNYGEPNYIHTLNKIILKYNLNEL